MDVYTRLEQLGLKLPDSPPVPIANFDTYADVGGLVFLSGQGPVELDGYTHRGQVGLDVSLDAATIHARLAGINLLAVMHQATGDLNRIARVVKVLGMVNAVPGFCEHPKVINGCSDLFVAVFGVAGRHARSSVGMSSLPDHITVEIESVIAIRS